MDNKKIEIEFSVKDNLTKQLKNMSQTVRNIAKEVQSSVKSIENSFNNISLGNKIGNQVKGINDKLKQIGKDIGDVEIDIKANVDKSGLSGLGDFLASGSMIGASSSMTSSVDEMRKSIADMSKDMREMFTAGVKDTKSFQDSIRGIGNAYADLDKLMGDINAEIKVFEDEAKSLGIDFNLEDNIFSIGTFKDKVEELASKVMSLKGYFDNFSDVNGVSECITVLERMSSVLDDIIEKTYLTEKSTGIIGKDFNAINFDYSKAQEEIENGINDIIAKTKPNESLKITADIQDLVNKANEVANISSQLKSNEIEMKFNDDSIDDVRERLEKLKNVKYDDGMEKFAEITNKNIQKLTQTLTQYESKAKSLKSTHVGLSSQVAKAKNEFKSLNNEMNNTNSSASKLKGTMSGLKGILGKMGAIVGITQLLNFGKQAIQTASDLEEVQNVVDVVFGSSAETINTWAESISGSFGLTELQAKQFAGTFGSILKSTGVNSQYIEGMSRKLTELAGDLASFYNLDHNTAFDKLRQGITGSVEGLQALGINLNATTMQQYMLQQGIAGTWSELDQATQQILRFNYIMQVTQGVQGDYARTCGSFSNQVRSLSNAFSQLKAEVGIALMSALQPVISVIITVINYLTALMQLLNDFLRSIGLIKSIANAVGSAVSDTIGGAVGGIADIVGGVADAVGGVGDSADTASGSVANLKRELKGLLGIDELNILPGNEDSSGSAGGGAGAGGGGGSAGGGGGYSPDIGVDEGEAEKSVSVLDKIKEKILAHKAEILAIIAGLVSGILTYFAVAKWGAISKAIVDAFAIAKTAVGVFGLALSSTAGLIAIAVGAFVAGFVYLYNTCEEFRNSVQGFVADLREIDKAISDKIFQPIIAILKELWDGWLKPIVAFLVDVVLDAVQMIWNAFKMGWDVAKPGIMMLIDAFGKVFDAVKNLITALTPVWQFIVMIASFLWDNLLKPILSFVLDVVGVVIGVVIDIGAVILSVGGEILSFVINLLAGIIDGIVSFVKYVIENWDKVKEGWFALWRKVDELGKKDIEDIKTGFGNMVNWFKTKVIDPVANFFKKLKEDIVTFLKNGYNDICTAWSNAKSWFSNLLSNISNIFSTVWSNIVNFPRNAWNSICNIYNGAKSWFSNIFEGVKGAIVDKFNGVLSSVKTIFSNVQTTISNVITKIKGFFNFKWELPKIKLPHFSITGSANPLDWITQGVPRLSVKSCTFLVEILIRKFGKIGRKLSKLLLTNKNRYGKILMMDR